MSDVHITLLCRMHHIFTAYMCDPDWTSGNIQVRAVTWGCVCFLHAVFQVFGFSLWTKKDWDLISDIFVRALRLLTSGLWTTSCWIIDVEEKKKKMKQPRLRVGFYCVLLYSHICRETKHRLMKINISHRPLILPLFIDSSHTCRIIQPTHTHTHLCLWSVYMCASLKWFALLPELALGLKHTHFCRISSFSFCRFLTCTCRGLYVTRCQVILKWLLVKAARIFKT